MKAPAFEYHRAASVQEAIRLLGENEDAKVLAGGQSLLPLLNMRLARPSLLIDLNGLSELAYVRREGDQLAIGALTRHRDVETSDLVRAHAGLLTFALGHVGHVTIRNRGTIGGSIAHGDPAAELPAAMTALDAEFVVQGPSGSRTIRARDFFLGYLLTLLEPDEILTEIRVPVLPEGTGCAVEELTRRSGDFALVAVFVTLTLGADGTIAHARVSVAGAGSAPVRADDAEALLVGNRPSDEVFAAAAAAAAAATDPPKDIHAPAEYRREMVGVFARRALKQAAARADRGA